MCNFTHSRSHGQEEAYPLLLKLKVKSTTPKRRCVCSGMHMTPWYPLWPGSLKGTLSDLSQSRYWHTHKVVPPPATPDCRRLSRQGRHGSKVRVTQSLSLRDQEQCGQTLWPELRACHMLRVGLGLVGTETRNRGTTQRMTH